MSTDTIKIPLVLTWAEAHVTVEVLKAHREHCRKLQPDNKIIIVLDSVIAKLEGK